MTPQDVVGIIGCVLAVAGFLTLGVLIVYAPRLPWDRRPRYPSAVPLPARVPPPSCPQCKAEKRTAAHFCHGCGRQQVDDLTVYCWMESRKKMAAARRDLAESLKAENR
ncbi:MAG: hypothetical protein JWO31_377 [Phycisphaerales bacterium]|nr:hypothetical protein [Phycisphaerales bacterium]